MRKRQPCRGDAAPSRYGFCIPDVRLYSLEPRSRTDRTSSQILQANEKAKAWSTIIGNFGTALTIAGVGTLWVNGLDPWPVVWIALGIVIMMFATHLLNYLEAEN